MHVAALFDMDGLLIDSERSIMGLWLEAARSAGAVLSPAQYVGVIGRAAPESDALLIEAFGGQASFEAARGFVRERLEARFKVRGFPLKPGARALLAALSARGVPCAVASSSSRHEIETRLAAAGMLHHFAAVAGGDEVALGKPDPAVYRLAANRLGVRPEHCLGFEDSHNGAYAVLAAGARLVVVPDLLQPTEVLDKQSLRVLRSLEEALPLLDRWFANVNIHQKGVGLDR